MKSAQPDVEFVAEQAPPLGKIDAGAVVAGAGRRQAGRDLQRRCSAPTSEVRARGQHARPVPGRAGVQPADRRARVPRPAEGGDARGLVVTGYPWSEINTPEHTQVPSTPIRSAGTTTRASGSVVGYVVGLHRSRTAMKKAAVHRHREAGRRAEGPADRYAVRPDRLCARSTTSRRMGAYVGQIAPRTARASW